MKVYYQNSRSQVVDFMSFPYRISQEDLRNWSWDVDSFESTAGTKISRIYRKMATKKVMLHIRGTEEKSFYEAMDDLVDITDYDIVSNTPGKLYVDDMYISCYITASTKTNFWVINGSCDLELEITVQNPVWIRSDSAVVEDVTIDDSVEHTYPYGYPYGYPIRIFKRQINNDGLVPANFIMRIMGMCVNPEVTIGGVKHKINATAIAGQYFEVDSLSKTVYLVDKYGKKANMFKYRGTHLFDKIPVGANTISANGSYIVQLEVMVERSEPRWKTS